MPHARPLAHALTTRATGDHTPSYQFSPRLTCVRLRRRARTAQASHGEIAARLAAVIVPRTPRGEDPIALEYILEAGARAGGARDHDAGRAPCALCRERAPVCLCWSRGRATRLPADTRREAPVQRRAGARGALRDPVMMRLSKRRISRGICAARTASRYVAPDPARWNRAAVLREGRALRGPIRAQARLPGPPPPGREPDRACAPRRRCRLIVSRTLGWARRLSAPGIRFTIPLVALTAATARHGEGMLAGIAPVYAILVLATRGNLNTHRRAAHPARAARGPTAAR